MKKFLDYFLTVGHDGKWEKKECKIVRSIFSFFLLGYLLRNCLDFEEI